MNKEFHTPLELWHSKKRCCIVFSMSQKLHLVSPFQPLFSKLSFVKTTPLFKYERKILIFKGNLVFQNKIFPEILSLLIISLYKDWVKKRPFLLNRETETYSFSFYLVASTRETRLIQSLNLSPISALLNKILRGVVLSTFATKTFFPLAILYKYGKFKLKCSLPIHFWKPLAKGHLHSIA